MQREVLEKVMTEEEFLAYELASDVRHEYMNGRLFEKAGESKLNNDIAGNIYILLKAIVKAKGWNIYSHDVMLKIADQSVYYYPDLFITDEKESDSDYVCHSALLVVEILSPSTRHFDMFDKFHQYRKMSELRYYVLVETSKQLITLWEKDDKGEWSTELFDVKDGKVQMKYLALELEILSVFE